MSRPSKKRTDRAAELLAESVTQLMNSETFKAALRFRRKLHSYSFRNAWLIYCQLPEASMIAGYRRWQELGRQVRKGEKSLAIFAPLTRKNDEGDKEVFGFRTASVFDVSQTDGDDIPKLPRPEILTAEGENIDQLKEVIGNYAIAKGFTLEYRPLKRSLGVYNLRNKKIAVDDGLPPLQTLKTLVHELAHALMHSGQPIAEDKRHQYELEAESVTFIVCDALNLDTSQYSFAYLANWAENVNELLPAVNRACKVADSILEALSAPPVSALAIAA